MMPITQYFLINSIVLHQNQVASKGVESSYDYDMRKPYKLRPIGWTARLSQVTIRGVVSSYDHEITISYKLPTVESNKTCLYRWMRCAACPFKSRVNASFGLCSRPEHVLKWCTVETNKIRQFCRMKCTTPSFCRQIVRHASIESTKIRYFLRYSAQLAIIVTIQCVKFRN